MTSQEKTPSEHEPLSATEFHVLLVLAEQELYGYAILQAIQAESGGSVSPEIGSLYRVIARLVAEGLVEPVAGTLGDESSPGRPRKYYRLTPEGTQILRLESLRWSKALALVRERIPLAEPGQL